MGNHATVAALWAAGAAGALAGGVARGVWVDLLAAADESLVRFVNRFYRVPGFHHVVRAYFGGRYQQALARLAMRVAQRLARRQRDFARTARFVRTIGVSPAGAPVHSLTIVRHNVHFMLNAWPRLNRQRVQALLRHTIADHDRPATVRWVFSSRDMQLSRAELLTRLRRLLDKGATTPVQTPKWHSALPRIVLVT
ncbi:MAG: hypothetical protein R2867_23010 [Caldilineaceae bacterium]